MVYPKSSKTTGNGLRSKRKSSRKWKIIPLSICVILVNAAMALDTETGQQTTPAGSETSAGHEATLNNLKI